MDDDGDEDSLVRRADDGKRRRGTTLGEINWDIPISRTHRRFKPIQGNAVHESPLEVKDSSETPLSILVQLLTTPPKGKDL